MYTWMIQVQDPGEDWSDYWPVTTPGKDRRKALAQARKAIVRVHRPRWRLLGPVKGERFRGQS